MKNDNAKFKNKWLSIIILNVIILAAVMLTGCNSSSQRIKTDANKNVECGNDEDEIKRIGKKVQAELEAELRRSKTTKEQTSDINESVVGWSTEQLLSKYGRSIIKMAFKGKDGNDIQILYYCNLANNSDVNQPEYRHMILPVCIRDYKVVGQGWADRDVFIKSESMDLESQVDLIKAEQFLNVIVCSCKQKYLHENSATNKKDKLKSKNGGRNKKN